MNHTRRNKIRNAIALITEAVGIVSDVYDDEQECLDNTPENFQSGDKYTEREEVVDLLSDAISELESAEDKLEECV